MTGMSSPGLRSCKRLSSAQCHTKMARSTLSKGTRLVLYVPGQAPRWAPLLTHTTTRHGTCWVTITVPPSFYRLVNSGGVDFLSQHLDTGNLRFIYFFKSLNLLWPHTQWSQWQTLVSIENPSPPSKRSCSNLGLSHSQKKSEVSVLALSSFLLSFLLVNASWLPGNAETPSQGALVLRELHCCFQGWRAHSGLFTGLPITRGGVPVQYQTQTPQFNYPLSSQAL